MVQLNSTKKGLITGCIMVVLEFFLFFILRKPIHSHYQYIVYAIFVTGILWSIISFAKSTTTIKLGEYFSTGFQTFIVVTLLMVIFTFVFYSLHPEIRDAQIELNNQLLQQQGHRTPHEIVENAKQMKRIFMPMMLGITTFLYLLSGSVITLLSSIIIVQLKKN